MCILRLECYFYWKKEIYQLDLYNHVNIDIINLYKTLSKIFESS